MQLDRTVFTSDAFKKEAKKHWVLVEIDFPQRKKVRDLARNKKLAQKYAIDGYPTVVVLDQDGKQLGRVKGGATSGADAYIRQLKDASE